MNENTVKHKNYGLWHIDKNISIKVMELLQHYHWRTSNTKQIGYNNKPQIYTKKARICTFYKWYIK